MNGLAVPLAVLACCFAGAMGGYTLARPGDALAGLGLATAGETRSGLGAVRAAGGLLLLMHGAAAAMLGYSPGAGATMALVLAFGWIGAVIGRLASALRDGPPSASSLQTLAFEVLMAVTLALPYWTDSRGLPGPTILV